MEGGFCFLAKRRIGEGIHGGDIHGMGKVATRAAAEGGGCNRNALPLRSGRSSTEGRQENTSLSTDVPLGFLYAASPFPSLQAAGRNIFCNGGRSLLGGK